MPRKDRSFTHKDVIRIFERNLDDPERIKVLVYMLVYLLGFEKMRIVLKKTYEESKSLTLSDLAAVLMEVIDFFVLRRKKWKAVDFLFEWLLNTYEQTSSVKLKKKIHRDSSDASEQTELIA